MERATNLPDGVTKLNYDEDTWYDSRQKDVDNPVIDARGVSAHDWMDTSFTVTDRSHSKKETYLKIERATEMSFDEFAFFNYIFRPVEQWAGWLLQPQASEEVQHRRP